VSAEHPLSTVDDVAVAVLAFSGSRSQLLAVPVTPYRYQGRLIVTATLAYTRKAELIRRNPEISLLAGGVQFSGRANVFADPAGDFFVGHLLQHELRKYPPARSLVRVPTHRRVFAWYFGRAIIAFEPSRSEARQGDDHFTLITQGPDESPDIGPIHALSSVAPPVELPLEGAADGKALLLAHRESEDMSDLRQLSVRGEISDGVFRERSRSGNLDGSGGGGPPGRGR
jgi:hypothetical protein